MNIIAQIWKAAKNPLNIQRSLHIIKQQHFKIHEKLSANLDEALDILLKMPDDRGGYQT